MVRETNSREHERHLRLARYSDYDAFTFYHTDAAEEFPRGPIQVTVRGRTCGTLTMDWEPVVGALSEIFYRPELNGSEEDKRRLAKAAAESAVFHVLEFLPQKIDTALEQLCAEAFIGFVRDRSVLRRIAISSSFAEFVEQILQAEQEAIKERLRISMGPHPSFLNRDHYEDTLLAAIARVPSNQPITQESVAWEMKVDASMVRRWNRQYGVNWAAFIRPFRNRTNSG